MTMNYLIILLFMMLFMSCKTQWSDDVILEEKGKAVYEDDVVSKCINKVYLLNSSFISINATELRNILSPADHEKFDKFVRDRERYANAVIIDFYDKRCYDSRDTRSVGAIMNVFSKGLAAGGKYVAAHKTSSLFNFLTTSLGFYEIYIAKDNAANIEKQGKKIGALDVDNAVIRREVDLGYATNKVVTDLIPQLEDLKREIDNLMSHGRLTSYEEERSPQISAVTTIQHEIILRKCTKNARKIYFDECRSYTSQEHVKVVVESMHVGTFNYDRTIFSRIMLNRTSIREDGRLVPVLLSSCIKPQSSKFFDKIHVCPSAAVIVPSCSIDNLQACEIVSTKTNEKFLDIKVIGTTYIIATTLKAFNIFNSSSGLSTYHAVTSPTFKLKLPSDSYATIGDKKLIGLYNNETVSYQMIHPHVQVQVDAWKSQMKQISSHLSMIDKNRDWYPDNQMIYAGSNPSSSSLENYFYVIIVTIVGTVLCLLGVCCYCGGYGWIITFLNLRRFRGSSSGRTEAAPVAMKELTARLEDDPSKSIFVK